MDAVLYFAMCLISMTVKYSMATGTVFICVHCNTFLFLLLWGVYVKLNAVLLWSCNNFIPTSGEMWVFIKLKVKYTCISIEIRLLGYTLVKFYNLTCIYLLLVPVLQFHALDIALKFLYIAQSCSIKVTVPQILVTEQVYSSLYAHNYFFFHSLLPNSHI